jgi:hypothetical protein
MSKNSSRRILRFTRQFAHILGNIHAIDNFLFEGRSLTLRTELSNFLAIIVAQGSIIFIKGFGHMVCGAWTMFNGFWSLTLSDVLFCAFCGRLPRVLR